MTYGLPVPDEFDKEMGSRPGEASRHMVDTAMPQIS